MRSWSVCTCGNAVVLHTPVLATANRLATRCHGPFLNFGSTPVAAFKGSTAHPISMQTCPFLTLDNQREPRFYLTANVRQYHGRSGYERAIGILGCLFPALWLRVISHPLVLISPQGSLASEEENAGAELSLILQFTALLLDHGLTSQPRFRCRCYPVLHDSA